MDFVTSEFVSGSWFLAFGSPNLPTAAALLQLSLNVSRLLPNYKNSLN
jgi:hypothetical protein